jgi:hypothetical protein
VLLRTIESLVGFPLDKSPGFSSVLIVQLKSVTGGVGGEGGGVGGGVGTGVGVVLFVEFV